MRGGRGVGIGGAVAARPSRWSVGFTLAELVVAAVVLQVGILGAASLVVLAGRTLAGARDREWAVQEARAVADSLVAAPTPGDGVRALPFGRVEWRIGEGGGARGVVWGVDGKVPLVDVGLVLSPREGS